MVQEMFEIDSKGPAGSVAKIEMTSSCVPRAVRNPHDTTNPSWSRTASCMLPPGAIVHQRTQKHDGFRKTVMIHMSPPPPLINGGFIRQTRIWDGRRRTVTIAHDRSIVTEPYSARFPAAGTA